MLEEGLATKVWVRVKGENVPPSRKTPHNARHFLGVRLGGGDDDVGVVLEERDIIPHSLGMRSIKRLGSHNGIFHVRPHISRERPDPILGRVSSVAKGLLRREARQDAKHAH